MLGNEDGNGIVPLFCAKAFQNGKGGFTDSVMSARAVRRQVGLKGVVVCHFGLHKPVNTWRRTVSRVLGLYTC